MAGNEKSGNRTGAKRARKAWRKDAWQVTQPECIEMIMQGIGDVRSQASIARSVAKTYDISHSGALKRVAFVWDRLASESSLDKTVERRKLSLAILEIYREAKEDMGLANCVEMLTAAGLSVEQRYRILAKWDPYKGAGLALKALEQYAKLGGLNAPELMEVKDTTLRLDPLTMTPQERRKKITELLTKGKLKGPSSGPSAPPSIEVEDKSQAN